jgi:hypothetical protein
MMQRVSAELDQAMNIRILPFEEWDKLDGFPIAANGFPNPETSIILVAELPSGEIVGTWEAVAPVILEGLWVREDYHKTSVLPRLFETMKSTLRNMNIDRAYTLVQTPDVKALAEHGGFEMIPGDLCVLNLEQA